MFATLSGGMVRCCVQGECIMFCGWGTIWLLIRRNARDLVGIVQTYSARHTGYSADPFNPLILIPICVQRDDLNRRDSGLPLSAVGCGKVRLRVVPLNANWYEPSRIYKLSSTIGPI